MRRNFVSLSAVAVGIALVLAGCGGNETSGQAGGSSPAPSTSSRPGPSSSAPPSGAPADQESVAWMDGFCGQILKLGNLSKIEKPKTQKGDIAATKKEISEFIGKVVDETSAFVQGLKGLPSAPVPEGDKAVRGFIDIFEPAKAKLASVQTKLDAAAPNDKAAVAEAAKGMKSFSQSMSKVSSPINELKGTKLTAAGKQAPNCKKLGSFGG